MTCKERDVERRGTGGDRGRYERQGYDREEGSEGARQAVEDGEWRNGDRGQREFSFNTFEAKSFPILNNA